MPKTAPPKTTPRNGSNRKSGNKAARVAELPKITNTTDTRDILAHATKEPNSRLLRRRHRRPRDRDGVLVGDHRPHRQRRLQRCRAPSRIAAARRPGLLNAHARHAVPGRVRPHSASAAARPKQFRARARIAQVALVQRAMDSHGHRLHGGVPDADAAARHASAGARWRSHSGHAFNRWLIEQVLPHEPRIKAMLYLPFNDPEACVKVVEEFADSPGVIGFL